MVGQKLTTVDFEQVVRDKRARIYRAACFLLDDAAEADDLTQQVFVAAWRGWQKFEHRSEPYTWLYRILLRVHSRHQRRRWWRERVLGHRDADSPASLENVADEQPAPDSATRRADDRLEVRAVIRGMSPKLRAVLVLRYSEDLPLEQIAATLGVPVGTVKSRLNLAQQTVADRLRKRGWS
jgi:RNA polymerase sigma-70 factor (ECF subfamily)